VAVRDPTDSFNLPEHVTWQMNFAVDHNEVIFCGAGGGELVRFDHT